MLWVSIKMKFKIIASGSKGNCTIVLCDNTNLIIDMGISYLTLKRSLEENSLSFSNISGVLITHCHKDHISGLSTLVNKTDIKVYFSVDSNNKKIPLSVDFSLYEYISKLVNGFKPNQSDKEDLIILDEFINNLLSEDSDQDLVVISLDTNEVFLLEYNFGVLEFKRG